MSTWRLRNPKNGKMEAFELKEDRLWLDGLPAFGLDEIESVQLDKVSGTQYNSAHYLLRIRAKSEVFAWQALQAQAETFQDYREAVQALHTALHRGGFAVKYQAGLRHALLYWLFMGFFVALFGLLELAVIMGTMRKGNYYVGLPTMILVPFIAWFFLRFASKFLKPRSYSPLDIPADLLPPAN